ncbi:hypothetical protein [Streptomyces sp. NPDC051211]|uniref:hypothetical protein n=1 Tax=Streptomyces sp. NPDC051211 TaxID=3154643 RepID=UPI00344CCFA3
MPVRPTAPALALLLAAAALAGCAPQGATSGSATPAGTASAGAAAGSAATSAAGSPALPSPAGTPSATLAAGSPSPSPTAAQPRPVAPSPSRVAPTPPPASATRLAMSVSAPGGRLALVRGGPAQEFSVTLRNGNTRAYGHLLLAFQLESLLYAAGDVRAPGDGDGFVLERRDPASGAWRTVELRIANDVMPYWLLRGGTPLARDAVRTEKFRLRALTAGPTGSTPLMVSLVDTDAHGRVGSLSLQHTTTRR